MQDEIQKSQQILTSKPQFFKKQESSTFQGKKKRQKPKKFVSCMSEFSFKVEKKSQVSKTYRPPVQTNNEITLNPYYRFAVKSGDYRPFHNDPNLALDWDFVRKVRILTDSEVKCPICLEQELLVGRVNKCGHYYCWPCVIRYMWVSQGTKRCPICNFPLKSIDLRPVSVQAYMHITEGIQVTLTQIKRPKGSISLFSSEHPQITSSSNLAFSDSSHTWFNKISIYSESNSDYNKEKSQLTSAIQMTSDDFEKSSIQKALDLLEKTWENTEPQEKPKNNEFQDFYYFYQVSDGQPYFLHPVNMKILKRQFGSWDLCPLTLKCKLLEIERIHITEADQRKYGQLCHLGKNVVAYFIEVDLKKIVTNEVLSEFKQEVNFIQLTKRQKDRERFKRIEEKIQQKISIRRKNEEEANSLLLNYFENPVVAPVQKVFKFDSGKPDEPSEKKEEKKEQVEENAEENKNDSRSIWSNFGEVLKRPPRERQPVKKAEKEAEEEEEGPRKFTLYDLIKEKRK